MVLDHLMPSISPAAVDFFRCAYGVLLFLTLVATLPHGRRFFLSERWGGYGEECRLIDTLHNPIAYPVVMTLWLGCALCLVTGWFAPWAALTNLLICRYYCLRIRWKSLLRGLGAPGFMISWLAAAVVFLEFVPRLAPELTPLTVLVLQVDFGLVMFAAGLYKLNSGYMRGEGFEYALVNRHWCYWWNLYRKLPPESRLFWVNNQLAWGGEVVAGILLLIPATRPWGAALLVLCFSFIATHLRLLLLPHMVILTGLLYVAPSTPAHVLMGPLLALAPASSFSPAHLPTWGQHVLSVALWSYLTLLPFIYAALFFNFYLRKTMPKLLQSFVEQYANFFGIILWRVFSADLTHFFIMIYRVSKRTGQRSLVSKWGLADGLRFSHVGEALTVTTLFTLLKYQPDNVELFQKRLLRYTRTIPVGDEETLLFEFIHIVKTENCFVYKPVAEYEVEPVSGRVTERSVEPTFSPRAFMPRSPAFQVARPGSYVPVGK